MEIMDGKKIAALVLEECRSDIISLAERQLVPGLAVILVGNDPASRAYVRSKEKMCRELGMKSVKHELAETTAETDLIALVEALNRDPSIHGILVQSPLPSHMNEARVVRAIHPGKDVDGFHPENVAKLTMEDPTGFVPCTPAGCLRLLQAHSINASGAHVVVLGAKYDCGKTSGPAAHGQGSRCHRYRGP
jgi:methylenetetrahydrofolate dehydrogenase (NADP+) / methenyltetrahydrofolate cyclohydrolase